MRVELLDSHNTNIVYCVCALGKVKYVDMTRGMGVIASGVVVMASGVEPRQRKNASGFSTQGVLNILLALLTFRQVLLENLRDPSRNGNLGKHRIAVGLRNDVFLVPSNTHGLSMNHLYKHGPYHSQVK